MRILFQGDSITDAGRARDNDVNLGIGYPLLVKAQLGFEEAGKYITNVSFNRPDYIKNSNNNECGE